ncbi:uroporphyrinogen-III synthase [Arenibaculum sp.]|uniref:uroporphyrinogen-III synthase n=1 Tax=Arenibaculum sp. TaxID=2865862 RepID=UPI002E0EA47C|nr:uroporphyrinogen-III synthase [Arenibaculum sp.]
MSGPYRRLLVTRPGEDGRALAALVEARGATALIDPMLEIEHHAGPPLDLAGAQALLFTSANGVRAAAARTSERSLPAFAVGDATARAARAAGFADVRSAGGDVGDLTALVARSLVPGAGRLVHAAGTAVAGDLGAALAAAGFVVERAVLYAARPAASLAESTVRELYAGTIDAVLFFSPRTARSFVRLAGQAGLDARLVAVDALCLSTAVAMEARTMPWHAIRVAERPEQATLLDLLR